MAKCLNTFVAHCSFKKSLWNSSHNQLNQLHGLTLTELTRNLQQLQQNTFSLQKGPCWSFEANKPGKQTIIIFQDFSEVDFLTGLEEVFLQMFSLQLAEWRVFMYCQVNDLGGKIPTASSGKFVICAACEKIFTKEICWMLSQRKFLRPFKAKWVLILQTIFGVCHWKIIAEWWSLES